MSKKLRNIGIFTVLGLGVSILLSATAPSAASTANPSPTATPVTWYDPSNEPTYTPPTLSPIDTWSWVINPSSKPTSSPVPAEKTKLENTAAPQQTPDPTSQSQIEKTKEQTKNHLTTWNIKNKSRCSIRKKITIKDPDGILSIQLNGRKIKLPKNKKKFSLSLSKYKKRLKRHGAWNKLIIKDNQGNKAVLRFKIKL